MPSRVKVTPASPMTLVRWRAEDAIRYAKLGDRDKARQMLLAALKALPPKGDGDG